VQNFISARLLEPQLGQYMTVYSSFTASYYRNGLVRGYS